MNDMNSIADFKGNPFYTFRVWFMWGIVLVLAGYVAVQLIVAGDITNLLAELLVLVVFFLASATWMYYFQLTDSRLIIRNHQCFWYRKQIDLDKISNIEVVCDGNTGIATNWLGYRRGWPVALRIYLAPEYPDTFYACTLSDKQWKALEAAYSKRKQRNM